MLVGMPGAILKSKNKIKQVLSTKLFLCFTLQKIMYLPSKKLCYTWLKKPKLFKQKELFVLPFFERFYIVHDHIDAFFFFRKISRFFHMHIHAFCVILFFLLIFLFLFFIFLFIFYLIFITLFFITIFL